MPGPRGGAEERQLRTVLFTDIVGSTELAGRLGDEEWRKLLGRHHAVIRRELRRFGGREIDNAGDGFFMELPSPNAAVRCAAAVIDGVRPLDLYLRAGIHTGESVRVGAKVSGIAVHIGARIASLAGPGEILVSSTVHDVMSGSDVQFDDRGMRQLKGVDGEWRLWSVRREGDLAPVQVPAPPEPPAEGRARWRVPLVAGVAVAAIAIAALLLTRHAPAKPHAERTTPPASSPSGGAFPGPYDGGVFVLDPDTNTIVQGNRSGSPAVPVVPYKDQVWVGIGRNDLGLYNQARNEYVEHVAGLVENRAEPSIVFARGSMWVLVRPPANGVDSFLRLDPDDGHQLAPPVTIHTLTAGLVYRAGQFWTGSQDGRLIRFDAASGLVTDAIPLPKGTVPTDLVADGSLVYVMDEIDGSISRVDLVAHRATHIDIDAPLAVAVGGGRVWVTTQAGLLLGLNPTTLVPEVTNQHTDSRSFELAVGSDSVWVGSKEGKIFRVSLANPEAKPVTIDLGGRLNYISIAATPHVIWVGDGN